MASYFTLGSFAFETFAMPEVISFGFKENIVQHTLIGGERVFDLMGPDDEDITWSGIFLGATATDSVNAIRAMRRTVQTLTWGQTSQEVLVKSAVFRQSFNKTEYTIIVAVTKTVPATAPTVSTVQSVRTDVAAATTAASPVTGLAKARETLLGVAAQIKDAKAEVVGVLTTLREVQTTVTTTVQSAQTVIAAVGNLGSLGGSTTATLNALTALNGAFDTATAGADLTGYVGRAIKTIENR